MTSDLHRRKELVGACVVSAAGSLPLHVMPFMVSLATTDGRLAVERAGLLSSFYMAGLLAATIGLPALGFRRVTAQAAFACVPCLVAALWLGATQGAIVLLLGWFLIGAICGLFQFLGSTSAASHLDRHFVFGLRLALVLFASSAVIGIGGLFGGFASFGGASVALGSSFALCSLGGLIWYRQPPTLDRPNRSDLRRSLLHRRILPDQRHDDVRVPHRR